MMNSFTPTTTVLTAMVRRGAAMAQPPRIFSRLRPDLTAEHIYGHSDGDLFWWISNGIGEAMPPFAAVLDETARWNLIDFHSRQCRARRLAETAGHGTSVALPIPEFFADCPDGRTVSVATLRGQVVRMRAGCLLSDRSNSVNPPKQFRPLEWRAGVRGWSEEASTPARPCRTGTRSGCACRHKTACSWNRHNGTRT
jgi:hypothetical protein